MTRGHGLERLAYSATAVPPCRALPYICYICYICRYISYCCYCCCMTDASASGGGAAAAAGYTDQLQLARCRSGREPRHHRDANEAECLHEHDEAD